MYKITDEHFTNYFEKAFRNLDEVHEEHLNLETLRQKNSISKISTKELHDVGSVVHNIEASLDEYGNLTVHKFVDLFNGIISSINAKSYSSAIVLSRALYEHFAMFVLKKSEFKKLLIDKDFLKLSKDLIYWNTYHQNKKTAVDYKRTHVMDAIRYLKIYYAGDWERWPDQSENFYEDQYHELSELTHPASNSLLMYISDYKEKMSKDGFTQKITYSKNVREDHLYHIGWLLNIVSNYLVSDIYPDYIDNVLKKFDAERDYIVKFFTLNPSYAKEILDKTLDKKEVDKQRDNLNLDDIDKLRFDYRSK